MIDLRRFRVIECVSPLVSQELQLELHPTNGELIADPQNDVLKIVAVDRLTRGTDLFVGFIKGYGLCSGAVASTLAWDSSCLVAVGANDADLAGVIGRLIETQGGTALVDGGELVAELSTPLGGTLRPGTPSRCC